MPRGLIGVAFWGTQILVTWLGMGYIVEGTMTAGDLVGVSLSIHEIIWTVRYLIDLVPEMVRCDLLCPPLFLTICLKVHLLARYGGTVNPRRFQVVMIEPIERVATTLDSIPRIEPHPGK
eukprot:COSAG05_NODE_799_length_7238_cov_4.050707_7_plen_120_part_00